MPVDNSPNNPPKQFRPGPGQAGQAAALHRPPGRPPSGGKQQSSGAETKPPKPGGAKLGMPEPPPAPPPDMRHLAVGLQHHNIVGLGRDMPIGLWLIRNGMLGQLGKPDAVAHDWFLDT